MSCPAGYLSLLRADPNTTWIFAVPSRPPDLTEDYRRAGIGACLAGTVLFLCSIVRLVGRKTKSSVQSNKVAASGQG